MAKEVKPRERNYLARAKLVFNGKWTIGGISLDSMINNVIEFYNTNRVDKNRDVHTYYGVTYSVTMLRHCEGFWCEDIVSSWIDIFHERVASPMWLDVLDATVVARKGKTLEQTKFEAADAFLVTYRKTFA